MKNTEAGEGITIATDGWLGAALVPVKGQRSAEERAAEVVKVLERVEGL